MTGELRTADGAPIAGATIRVESSDLRSPLSGVTDASGHYAIDNVKPGIWAKITAFHQNGRVLARTFSLVTQYIVNLQARPESDAAVGSYCVRVFDAGNIPSATSVTYSVEVTHP